MLHPQALPLPPSHFLLPDDFICLPILSCWPISSDPDFSSSIPLHLNLKTFWLFASWRQTNVFPLPVSIMFVQTQPFHFPFSPQEVGWTIWEIKHKLLSLYSRQCYPGFKCPAPYLPLLLWVSWLCVQVVLMLSFILGSLLSFLPIEFFIILWISAERLLVLSN